MPGAAQRLFISQIEMYTADIALVSDGAGAKLKHYRITDCSCDYRSVCFAHRNLCARSRNTHRI